VAEVPPGVVRVMSTVPDDSEGEVAVHKVGDEQLTAVAVVAPNLAVVLPMTKPAPVMVTTVPPPSGPSTGLTELTVGAASYVN
jgi:hypothetical protein